MGERTRTFNTQFWRLLLFQLSYTHKLREADYLCETVASL